METKGAAWIDVQMSIASVRSGEEVLATVIAVEPTALVLEGDGDIDEDAFRVGDNLRVGWADQSRWQHGVAMLVGTDPAARRLTLSIPEATEAPEVRRSASRIEAFYAVRAIVPESGEPRVVNGRSFEVSVGGFSARFAEHLPEGVPFAVAIATGDEPVVAVATVVRHSDRYAHAAFTQIRESDRDRLAGALGLRALGG